MCNGPPYHDVCVRTHRATALDCVGAARRLFLPPAPSGRLFANALSQTQPQTLGLHNKSRASTYFRGPYWHGGLLWGRKTSAHARTGRATDGRLRRELAEMPRAGGRSWMQQRASQHVSSRNPWTCLSCPATIGPKAASPRWQILGASKRALQPLDRAWRANMVQRRIGSDHSVDGHPSRAISFVNRYSAVASGHSLMFEVSTTNLFQMR